MSSPSRPASVAHTTSLTSGSRSTFFTTANCPFVPSETTSGHSEGRRGRAAADQGFHSGLISGGSARRTRWPMAQVTT